MVAVMEDDTWLEIEMVTLLATLAWTDEWKFFKLHETFE